MSDGSGFVGRFNGHGSAWSRKPSDFYPTPWDVTQALLDFLELPPGCRILEPACGCGDMAWVLEAAGHEVTAMDLNHTGYGLGGIDFLRTHGYHDEFSFDAVITNPPFDQALQFARKALEHAETVALLLKTSYWHSSRRLKFFRDNPPTWVLPLTWRPAFLEDERGKSPFMDCLWTVWTAQLRGGHPAYCPLDRPAVGIGEPPMGVRLAHLRMAMMDACDVRRV